MDKYANITKIKSQIEYEMANAQNYRDTCRLRDALKIIESVPGENVRPITKGHWTLEVDKGYKCSCCGKRYLYTANYCGNCGAEMEKREE